MIFFVCGFFFFFFNDTATTEIYTLSLHDALPIARRPARAVARELIVRTAVRPEAVRRADGDGRRLVPRRVDGAVHLLPRSVLPVVARGGDDHDARGDETAHGVARRVVAVRVHGGRAQ